MTYTVTAWSGDPHRGTAARHISSGMTTLAEAMRDVRGAKAFTAGQYYKVLLLNDDGLVKAWELRGKSWRLAWPRPHRERAPGVSS